MRVLVTGASGFLGSHLVRALKEAGHEVVGLDRRAPPEQNPLDRFVQGDVTDAFRCREALEGCRTVFHLAAKLGDWGPHEPYLRVNVAGTRTLLDAAEAAGVQRFLFVSSVAVHHYAPGHPHGDEETPADGSMNAYARSKLLAERVVQTHGGSMTWTIVRPAVFPFGPGDETGFGPLARALMRGLVPLVSGGRARLTTAYAENLAEGLVAAAKPEGANQVFVLGDDQPVTWKQLLGEIAARIGASPPRLSLPFGPTRVLAKAVERLWARLPTSLPPPLTEYRVLLAGRDLCFFAHKARRVLGFAPKVRLEEALDRTAAWFLSAGGPHGGIRPPRRA